MNGQAVLGNLFDDGELGTVRLPGELVNVCFTVADFVALQVVFLIPGPLEALRAIQAGVELEDREFKPVGRMGSTSKPVNFYPK